VIDKRPHFKEYVMARLVSMAVGIFVLLGLIAWAIIDDTQALWSVLVLMAAAFLMFVFAIYRGARRMQHELMTINRYLKNMDKIEKIDHKAQFFTREFEEINQNLIKVLKKAKEREDIKQRYNAKLKLKNKQRADMLSAIAHEFRNPIASIMGYSQTLVDDRDIPKPLHDKFLRKIYSNGEKIESLLARLILWNKFESKETTLHKSSFDLRRLVEEVIQALQEKYKDRKIDIRGESTVVEADRALLEVVLKNLIENALKYSKDTITVTLHEHRVCVIDKGVGINEKDIEKVTKKFYRSGTHSWNNSMGLGLAIVKTILQMHGSNLEIESRKDEGSRFCFNI
jgi:two-component system phosphate regulon sensor histidine kinase PhoR